MSKVENDPNNYHEMSKPFENPEQANQAISDFYEDLKAIRKKHKIPDVLVVLEASVIYESGNRGEFMHHVGLGDARNQCALGAFAYGQTQADHREFINTFIHKAKEKK